MAIRIMATPRTKSTDVMRDTFDGAESTGVAGLNDDVLTLTVLRPIFESRVPRMLRRDSLFKQLQILERPVR